MLIYNNIYALLSSEQTYLTNTSTKFPGNPMSVLWPSPFSSWKVPHPPQTSTWCDVGTRVHFSSPAATSVQNILTCNDAPTQSAKMRHGGGWERGHHGVSESRPSIFSLPLSPPPPTWPARKERDHTNLRACSKQWDYLGDDTLDLLQIILDTPRFHTAWGFQIRLLIRLLNKQN